VHRIGMILVETLSYNPRHLAERECDCRHAGARLVRRDGIDVRLAPKAFELLLILVRNQPNAVPHGQLHAVGEAIIAGLAPISPAPVSRLIWRGQRPPLHDRAPE